MQIVTDMGAHGAYVWPSYAAFLLIFGLLAWWAVAANTKARKRLEELEKIRQTIRSSNQQGTPGE